MSPGHRSKVPFLDLSRQYESIRDELELAISKARETFQFVKGPEIAAFENAFSRLLDGKNVVSTANGTDSLFLVLKALGIGPGDEVLTPAFSWISSAETITLCGGTPVFCDVDPKTYTLDPIRLREAITDNTKGVIAVHLYGNAARIGDIQAVCKQFDLFLIEDCAQAHLTADNDQWVGTFGNAGCFSFYPTKNLGAYGDAGCVVTGDKTLAEKIRRLANHGALVKDDHAFEGLNSRMDTIQAAVLLAKLPHLQDWNKQRQRLASLYSQLLSPIGDLITPEVREKTTHSFHLYVVRAERRNELKAYLDSKGVETMVHYPAALPNLPAYRYLQRKPEEFPVSTELAKQVISLPLYPELTESEVAYVCELIAAFYKK